MLQPKTYVKIFFALFGVLLIGAVWYVYDFSKHYPVPITNRISFDAKLKFIRDHIDPDKVDTIIVGSSIGMNNLLGSVLENHAQTIHSVVNLSVYEATTLEAEQILQLSDAFPNLKYILYSVQYSDTPHPYKYENYDPETLKKYIRHELSWIGFFKLMFHACNNLVFCYERGEKWEEEHMQRDQFTSLIFDTTGSVPLEIYRGKEVGGRWYLPHPGIMAPQSFAAMARIAQKAQHKGIDFYVVHQPYRQELYDKHKNVRGAMAYFDTQVLKAITPYGGKLITLQHLHLENKYCADRTHLNRKGSTIVSKYVAKKIDEYAKERK